MKMAGGSRWHQKWLKITLNPVLHLWVLPAIWVSLTTKVALAHKEGPDIRKQLANLAWHLNKPVLDAGTVIAVDDMEQAQTGTPNGSLNSYTNKILWSAWAVDVSCMGQL